MNTERQIEIVGEKGEIILSSDIFDSQNWKKIAEIPSTSNTTLVTIAISNEEISTPKTCFSVYLSFSDN